MQINLTRKVHLPGPVYIHGAQRVQIDPITNFSQHKSHQEPAKSERGRFIGRRLKYFTQEKLTGNW